MIRKTIGFNETIPLIGHAQGAVYSMDSKNKIKEVILLKREQTDSGIEDYYFNPTSIDVQFGIALKLGKVYLAHDGNITVAS